MGRSHYMMCDNKVLLLQAAVMFCRRLKLNDSCFFMFSSNHSVLFLYVPFLFRLGEMKKNKLIL